jgi:hypothetical protein
VFLSRRPDTGFGSVWRLNPAYQAQRPNISVPTPRTDQGASTSSTFSPSHTARNGQHYNQHCHYSNQHYYYSNLLRPYCPLEPTYSTLYLLV